MPSQSQSQSQCGSDSQSQSSNATARVNEHQPYNNFSQTQSQSQPQSQSQQPSFSSFSSQSSSNQNEFDVECYLSSINSSNSSTKRPTAGNESTWNSLASTSNTNKTQIGNPSNQEKFLSSNNLNSQDSEMTEVEGYNNDGTQSQSQPAPAPPIELQPTTTSTPLDSTPSSQPPPLTYLLSRLLQLSTSYLGTSSSSQDLISATFYSYLAITLFPTHLGARQLFAICLLNGGEIFPFNTSSSTSAASHSGTSFLIGTGTGAGGGMTVGNGNGTGNSSTGRSKVSSALSALHILESGPKEISKDRGSALVYSKACEVLGRFKEAEEAFRFGISEDEPIETNSNQVNKSSGKGKGNGNGNSLGICSIKGPISPVPPTPTTSSSSRIKALDRIALANLLRNGNRREEASKEWEEIRKLDGWNWSAWVGDDGIDASNFNPNQAFPASLIQHSYETFIPQKFLGAFRSSIPDLNFELDDSTSAKTSSNSSVSKANPTSGNQKASSKSMPPPKARGTSNSSTSTSTSFPRPGSRITTSTSSVGNSSTATSIGTKRTRSVAAAKNEKSSNSTANAFGISGNGNVLVGKDGKRTGNGNSGLVERNSATGGPTLSASRTNVVGVDKATNSDLTSDEKAKDGKGLVVKGEVKQKVLPQRVTRATTGPGTPVNLPGRRTTTSSTVGNGGAVRRAGTAGNGGKEKDASTTTKRSTSNTSSTNASVNKSSGLTSTTGRSALASSISSNKSSISRKDTKDSASSSEPDLNSIAGSKSTTSSTSRRPQLNSSTSGSRENQTSSSSAAFARLQKERESKLATLERERMKQYEEWNVEKEKAENVARVEAKKWMETDSEIVRLLRSLSGAWFGCKAFEGEKTLGFLRLRNDCWFEEKGKGKFSTKAKGKGKAKENQNLDEHKNQLYHDYVRYLTGTKSLESNLDLNPTGNQDQDLSQEELSFKSYGPGIPKLIRDSFFIRILLGKTHHDLASYHLSEKEFLYARKLNPFDPTLMDIYSISLFHLNREALLSSLSQELLLLDSGSIEGHISSGNAFALQSNHELALRCFRRAILINPNKAYSFTLAGYESLELGLLEEAMALFRNGIRNDRFHWNGWAGLGRCFIRAEKWEFARECYETAIGINKNNSVLWELLGTTLERLRQVPLALTAYTRSIQLSPSSATARLKRAELLTLQGQHQSAHGDLLQVCALAPSEARVHLLLAHSYMRRSGGKFAQLRGGMATATGASLNVGSSSIPSSSVPLPTDVTSGGVGGVISQLDVSARNAHKAIGEPLLPKTHQNEIANHLAAAIELDPRCAKIIRSMGEGAKSALRGVAARATGPGEGNRIDRSEDSSMIRDTMDGNGEEMYEDRTETEEADEESESEEEEEQDTDDDDEEEESEVEIIEEAQEESGVGNQLQLSPTDTSELPLQSEDGSAQFHESEVGIHQDQSQDQSLNVSNSEDVDMSFA